MSHPKVSVLILNWNGAEDTTECLESLLMTPILLRSFTPCS